MKKYECNRCFVGFMFGLFRPGGHEEPAHCPNCGAFRTCKEVDNGSET